MKISHSEVNLIIYFSGRSRWTKYQQKFADVNLFTEIGEEIMPVVFRCLIYCPNLHMSNEWYGIYSIEPWQI